MAQVPSGHLVALDSDRSSNGAPGPMELLLVALGACTATDVVSILAKKRQKLDSLEVEVSGERAAEPPAVWVKLEIVYKLRGNLAEEAVKHAIQLSDEKYCRWPRCSARPYRLHSATRSRPPSAVPTNFG